MSKKKNAQCWIERIGGEYAAAIRYGPGWSKTGISCPWRKTKLGARRDAFKECRLHGWTLVWEDQ